MAINLTLEQQAHALAFACTHGEDGCTATHVFGTKCPFEDAGCSKIAPERWAFVLQNGCIREYTVRVTMSGSHTVKERAFNRNAALRQAEDSVRMYVRNRIAGCGITAEAEIAEDEESASSYTPYCAVECGAKKTETEEDEQ